MSEDVAKLMTTAQVQLDEHKAWLKEQLLSLYDEIPLKLLHALTDQVDGVRLRMARVDSAESTSILWEYPDELITFLRDPTTPEHLRKTLEGGRIVDLERQTIGEKVS